MDEVKKGVTSKFSNIDVKRNKGENGIINPYNEDILYFSHQYFKRNTGIRRKKKDEGAFFFL